MNNAKIYTILHKVFFIIIGLVLILFYGFLFMRAFVNLPDSWKYVLFTGTGLGAGISCFIYLKNRSRVLLLYIGAATLLTIAALFIPQ